MQTAKALTVIIIAWAGMFRGRAAPCSNTDDRVAIAVALMMRR
ncbi:hypothetical protein [Devosia sp.]